MNQYEYGRGYGDQYNYNPDTAEFPPQPGPEYNEYGYGQGHYDPNIPYQDQDFAQEEPVQHIPEHVDTPTPGEKAKKFKKLKRIGVWMMLLSIAGLMTNLAWWVLAITFVIGYLFWDNGDRAVARWENQQKIQSAHLLPGVPPEQFY